MKSILLNNYKISCLLFGICLLSLNEATCQLRTEWDFDDGSVLQVSESSLFRTEIGNANDTSDTKLSKMAYLDFSKLYKSKDGAFPDLSGGIIANMSPGDFGGVVEISVWSYDKTANHPTITGGKGGKGALIYKIYSDQSSGDFVEKYTWMDVQPMDEWHTLQFRSNQIKALSQYVDLYADNQGVPDCQDYRMSVGERFWRTVKYWFTGETFNACERYYSAVQPVIIEMRIIDGAKVNSIKIPGMGVVTPVSLFMDDAKLWQDEIDVANASVELDSDQINLSSDLINNRSEAIYLSNVSYHFESLTKDNPLDYADYAYGEEILLPANGDPVSFTNFTIGQISQPLPEDTYGAYISYTITDPDFSSYHYKLKTYLSYLRVSEAGDISVYDVPKEDYSGLPVYQLMGGMSAEYAVQKALAALDGGVSHTWAVTTNAEGNPDLEQGGPVPVWGDPDFLSRSVKRTVELYDENLGSNTPFETVIIGVGLANLPYLSFQMKAPFLPLHFLTSAHSLKEVKGVVDRANDKGYSCFATAGYDPSMPGIGVAWIKLLQLPEEYKTFLSNHNVQNIIFVGTNERSIGETEARKVHYHNTTKGTYDEGSVYVMDFGGEEGQKNLKAGFKDYEKVKSDSRFGPRVSIADWEGGIADIQIENFRQALVGGLLAPNIFTIRGIESLDFYQLASYLTLKHYKKNELLMDLDSMVHGIFMNEYLIGYPGYEALKRSIPNLYWQGSPGYTIKNNMTGYLKDRVQEVFPQVTDEEFFSLNVHFNAKYDRSAIKNTLETADSEADVAFSSVTMNTWQKADVWDPSDGMDAPCEMVAESIISSNGGAEYYKYWLSLLLPLTPEDLEDMAVSTTEDRSYTRGSGHPSPSSTTLLKSFDNAGIQVRQYEFDPSPYWQAKTFPGKIPFTNITDDVNAKSMGFIDGGLVEGKERFQKITIAEFDLSNQSDELDLKIDYKFDPKTKDGFKHYNRDNGDQQVMDCFEYVKVPKTEWLDIPSRVMARNGAVLILNGTVYDWDYNGIPGVVPFIKMEDDIKAQPQILSYKGEAYFAWEWGVNKSVKLDHRTSSLPENTLVGDLTSLFHDETYGYSNAMSGMTYMTGAEDYNITDYQPGWMIDYPALDPRYLGPSGTWIRCYLADPVGCVQYTEEVGTVPFGEGWNDCSKLVENEFVERFSTLAYRQYDQLFDQFPNARTFIATKGNQLDIGIIDGDLGTFGGVGPIMTKTMGMRNWEVSNFVRYKGYDHFMHLDGGSSTQMWLNGRGPLHDPSGYPLKNDNQGPYFSRLVSSYIMLVPKKHENQIRTHSSTNAQYLLLDNSAMSFNYDDSMDHEKDKSFVSLSPSMNDLKGEDQYGMLAGNFRVENSNDAMGAILFSMGEDSYYPDTEGSSLVIPKYRNMMVAGVGKIPSPLRDSLLRLDTIPYQFESLVYANNQAFYYFKLYNGVIQQYDFAGHNDYRRYLDNEWHSFVINRGSEEGDGFSLFIDNERMDGTYSHSSHLRTNLFDFHDLPVTHAMIGAVNVDGRFVAGNAKLNVDNFLIARGEEAMDILTRSNRINIRNMLHNHRELPDISLFGTIDSEAIYTLEFEETAGQHSFGTNLYPGNPTPDFDQQFYGLNLNAERKSYAGSGARIAAEDEIQSARTGMAMYPNPLSSDEILSVEFELEKKSPVHTIVYDIRGVKVWDYFEEEIDEGSHLVSFQNSMAVGLESGVYVLKVVTNNGEKTGRLLIK